MPLQSSPLTAPSSLETALSEKLDWKGPLLLVTAAFLFIGVSSVLRLLPIRTFIADVLATAAVLAWQYGFHLAGIARWNWRGPMVTFSSPSQGFLNLVTTFVLFMTVFSWTEGGPSANNVGLAAFVSFGIVFTKYRSKDSGSRSANT